MEASGQGAAARLRDVPMSASDAGFMPNAEQEILLTAALMSGERAADAWREWKARVPVRDVYVDAASFRLLPLVFKNLTQHVDDEYLTLMKASYRQAWTRNQILLHRLDTVLAGLSAAGIPTLVLKGAALTEQHYRDRGVRPMGDLDVAVQPQRAREAIDWLRNAGWQIGATSSLEFDLRFRHGCPFRDERARAEIDLHWHILTECCRQSVDEMLWAEAVPLRFGTASTTALSPADALLHVVVHGTRWNPLPPLRWIADGLTILRASGCDIDWQRLTAFAAASRLSLRVHWGLRYLRERFDAPIPDQALVALGAAPVGAIERLESRHLGGVGSWSGVNASSLVMAVAHCARATQDDPLPRRLAYLSSYMRERMRGKRVASRIARRALALPDDP